MRAYLVIALQLLAATTEIHGMEISRNNTVDWIAASAEGTSDSHFVQWTNPINAACQVSGGSYRTRLSMADSALFSLLLMAKSSKKKIGFYYNLTASTGGVPGHGTNCQIVNAWTESE